MEQETKAPVIDWKANYDVIVLGFGGAGATAARFAADNGAKVVIVDVAPYGHEGGNTRYSAQLLGIGTDYDKLKEYYHGLTHPMDLPEDMVETYVRGMCNMREYVKNIWVLNQLVLSMILVRYQMNIGLKLLKNTLN